MWAMPPTDLRRVHLSAGGRGGHDGGRAEQSRISHGVPSRSASTWGGNLSGDPRASYGVCQPASQPAKERQTAVPLALAPASLAGVHAGRGGPSEPMCVRAQRIRGTRRRRSRRRREGAIRYSSTAATVAAD
jgi:hypothetical protein